MARSGWTMNLLMPGDRFVAETLQLRTERTFRRAGILRNVIARQPHRVRLAAETSGELDGRHPDCDGSFKMIKDLACAIFALGTMLACSSVLLSQDSRPSGAAQDEKARTASHIPDLSGIWTVPGREGFSGRGTDKAGGVSMTSWGEKKYKAARPPFGEKQTFVETNDPVQKYCDPPGVTRLYNYPWQFTILQAPDSVYMLFEFSRVWRSIAMNQEHPKDTDSTWMGDSVGRYEGDTLVIDTIGISDKTWLDNAGHPHSDALHLVERLRRADHDTLELALTFDDPKAYTKSWTEQLQLKLSSSPMEETLCSVSEMEAFQRKVMDPTTTPPSRK